MPTQLPDQPTLPRQIALTRRFSLGAPHEIMISADGGTVFFLRSRGGTDPVSCLWALDCGTWTERLLADPLVLLAGAREELSAQEQARRERSRQLSAGIVSYAAGDGGRLLAFALSGQLWVLRTDGGGPERLPAREPVLDPRPDPRGARIAYVSGGALRVIEADGAADGTLDRAVAVPDGPDVTFGLPEHVAAESMGRHRGFWWAPDGQHLLVARADTSAVQRWYVSDPSDPARAPAAVPYPAAGTANADVSLWIAGLGTEPLIAVDWDNAAFEYLTAAGWGEPGPYAAVQSRDQRTVHVLRIDPRTGASEIAAIQRDDAWVTLVPGLPALTAGGTLLTSADLDDTRRLMAGGRPVTPPGLQLESVLSVDGEDVAFTASQEDPAQIGLWLCEVGAAGRAPRPLSEGPGMHEGTHRAGTTVLESASPGWLGTRVTVHTGRGSAELASLADEPVIRPRMELLSLGPRALRAALFLPSWHRPADPPLPVLMDPYGGPAGRKVLAGHDWTTYTSQWFAEQGFAVLVVDGRGTPGRGPAWERAIYLDIADPALQDQVDGLRAAAAARDDLDLTRVGIRGWSYGGYLAALGVLRRPDVFHAAVAGAPPTDQRMYDTHWRERYLGHPDAHPEVYDRCSLIDDAPALTRPLLLIHGMADDNVFPLHTLRLSAALLAAGRPHEVLPLSGVTHAAAGAAVSENMLLHQLGFLRRALGLTGRPA